ncbi:MAG: bifunctional folylpolyglutamate synthase/dihydrofolate synthase [Nanoarchaeota archaeon]|nr:bifunctional folylpolyglutamate synthase/dihydrofolate synthase [Nanoarchaeota archaeon]MBU1005210.1 bifunctional folylpolyglutamate synthase/dihydrofolate synthase [Nanoarchaeota archaeon]MBU1946881.1 bifunctional folylpolyglutamate synthase/dihydrofolate synthase [Nanoarchaeota archaeon]
MNYKQTLNFIYNLKGSEHKGSFNLSLENMKILLKKLNSPEKSLKIIHVAGTNGKGSVCAMLSSILKEAGYKVGMYISPHLKEFRERFTINKKMISEQELVYYLEKLKPFITDQTFFEVVTALAFLYFKEKKVDYLVCEVGLGGKLDATNIITPLVSIITNIGLEHQDYLGDTIEKIASEKAGIIKTNIPIITAAEGPALNVIKKAAKERNSEVFTVNNPLTEFPLRLNGDFQKTNASIASETIKVLNNHYNLKIKQESIKTGLLKTTWPGRLEFISKNTLVDCAHNPSAIKALKKELLKIKKNYKKVFLIFGVLKDKDHKKMLDVLTPLINKIIFVKPKIPRALDPDILAKETEKENIVIPDIKKALAYATKQAGKDDLILITGSIYLVGEVI